MSFVHSFLKLYILVIQIIVSMLIFFPSNDGLLGIITVAENVERKFAGKRFDVDRRCREVPSVWSVFGVLGGPIRRVLGCSFSGQASYVFSEAYFKRVREQKREQKGEMCPSIAGFDCEVGEIYTKDLDCCNY